MLWASHGLPHIPPESVIRTILFMSNFVLACLFAEGEVNRKVSKCLETAKENVPQAQLIQRSPSKRKILNKEMSQITATQPKVKQGHLAQLCTVDGF